MLKSELNLRVVAAIALTGVLTPLVCGVILQTVVSSANQNFKADEAIALIGLLGLFGLPIAFPCALIIGIFCELPKSRWFARKEGGFVLHVCSSMLLALLMAPVAFIIVFGLDDLTLEVAEQAAVTLGPPFAIGGLVSAIVWWLLVTKYLRSNNASNPPEPL